MFKASKSPPPSSRGPAAAAPGAPTSVRVKSKRAEENAAAVAAAAGAGAGAAAGAGGPGTVAQAKGTREEMLAVYGQNRDTYLAYKRMLEDLGTQSKLVAAEIEKEGKSMVERKKLEIENEHLTRQQEIINTHMKEFDETGDLEIQNGILADIAEKLEELKLEMNAKLAALDAEAPEGGRRRRRRRGRGSKTTKRHRRRNHHRKRNTRRHR